MACVWWVSVSGHAQTAGDSSRSAVLLGRVDAELLARIGGQTADLDWALIVEETDRVPDMSRAQAAGEKHGVPVVMWFEVSDRGGWVVNVAEIASRRLFSRHIEPPSEEETLASSTLAEAAALVVRSTLMAVAAGDEIGEVVADDSGPTSTGATPPVGASGQPSEPPGAGTGPTASSWQFSVGWQLALVPVRDELPSEQDGQNPSFQHGPSCRGALELGRWELALALSGAPWPSELKDDELTVRIHRLQALATIGYALLQGDELRLTAAAGAGAVGFYRSTRVHPEAEELWADEPPAVSAALLLRLGPRLQWFPSWTSHLLGLELALGADIVPAAPTFGVRQGEIEEPERVDDRYTLWPVHVVGSIALVFRTAKSRSLR